MQHELLLTKLRYRFPRKAKSRTEKWPYNIYTGLHVIALSGCSLKVHAVLSPVATYMARLQGRERSNERLFLKRSRETVGDGEGDGLCVATTG